MAVVSALREPPLGLRLVGHPLRWRLLSELAFSDRRVRELVVLLEEPQNVVSYHLAKLRSARLVTAQRSSFDARDTYYSVDLGRCGELLAGAGVALHPGLRLTASPPPLPAPPGPKVARRHVLFLCTGNSARSQMAEALLRHRADGLVEAASAGTDPKPLHPNAVKVMRAHGVDLSGHRPKPVGELAGRRFDYVVSLCDRAREICPEIAGRPATIHWSVPDPARAGDNDRETYPAFQRTAAQLDARIGFLVQLIHQTPPARRARR